MYRQNGGVISLIGRSNKGLFRDKRTKEISKKGEKSQYTYNFDNFEFRTKEKLIDGILNKIARVGVDKGIDNPIELFTNVYGPKMDGQHNGKSIEYFENSSDSLKTHGKITNDKVFLYIPWYIHFNNGSLGIDDMDKHVTMDINEYTNDYDNVRNKCKDKEQHTIVHFGREKKEGRTGKFAFKGDINNCLSDSDKRDMIRAYIYMSNEEIFMKKSVGSDITDNAIIYPNMDDYSRHNDPYVEDNKGKPIVFPDQHKFDYDIEFPELKPSRKDGSPYADATDKVGEPHDPPTHILEHIEEDGGDQVRHEQRDVHAVSQPDEVEDEFTYYGDDEGEPRLLDVETTHSQVLKMKEDAINSVNEIRKKGERSNAKKGTTYDGSMGLDYVRQSKLSHIKDPNPELVNYVPGSIGQYNPIPQQQYMIPGSNIPNYNLDDYNPYNMEQYQPHMVAQPHMITQHMMVQPHMMSQPYTMPPQPMPPQPMVPQPYMAPHMVSGPYMVPQPNMMDGQSNNPLRPNVQLPMGWIAEKGFNGSIYYIDGYCNTHWELPRGFQGGGRMNKRDRKKKNDRKKRTSRNKRTSRKKGNNRKKRTNRKKTTYRKNRTAKKKKTNKVNN